jgi:hypothetical protein
MEPIILELEREENDLLIIAHESVLRVLYGYLMACNAADIPKLEFPRDEIIEVSIINLPNYQSKQVLILRQIDYPIIVQQRRKTHQDPWSSRVYGPSQPRRHTDARTSKRRGQSILGRWHTSDRVWNGDAATSPAATAIELEEDAYQSDGVV